MLRVDKLLAGLSIDMSFLEIGPSYNPIVPKRDGWKVWTVDHTTRTGLIKKYQGHGVDVNNIEEVDFIIADGALESVIPQELHGAIDVCIASHVIEHTPDFVAFFKSLTKILSPSGIVSLAVPDKRFCFDYFRPHSTTGQVLEAYRNSATRHRAAAFFDFFAYNCSLNAAIAWGQLPVKGPRLIHSLPQAWDAFSKHPSAVYADCHAWQFTPSSFELIVVELAAIGLIEFRILRSFPSEGCEFIVQLQRGRENIQPPAELAARRVHLLECIIKELGEQANLLQTIPVNDSAALNSTGVAEFNISQFEEHSDNSQSIQTMGSKKDEQEIHSSVLTSLPISDIHKDSMQIPGCHATEMPTVANAFGIFRDDWSSAVPGFETGAIPLFDDARLNWLEEQAGGFRDMRILELGPLEGGHTFMMERSGAVVTAIESNPKAFLRCLIVKNALGLGAQFLYGDIRPYLKTCSGCFDFVLASGVLYHMVDPIGLLRDITRVAKTAGIWTHYYDHQAVQSRPELRDKFDDDPIVETIDGCTVARYRRHYRSELSWSGFCGGTQETSCWLTKDSLINYLSNLGWKITPGDENLSHPHGPCILLFLHRE